jgi:hypothetical protein
MSIASPPREMGTIPASQDLLESMASMRFPAKTDARMQSLMHRNNEGQLLPQEQEELESLVELSQELSLLRARALKTLGRDPV